MQHISLKRVVSFFILLQEYKVIRTERDLRQETGDTKGNGEGFHYTDEHKEAT